MSYLLIISSALMSSLVVSSTHPVILVVLILTQTLIISILLWLNFSFSWIAFILFLIFVGGLMVLFVYIVSLASNEKFNFSYPQMLTSTLWMLLFFFLTINLFSNELLTSSFIPMSLSTMKIYLHSTSPIILMAMLYLLFTLVVVVKIMENMKGPLRSMI